MGKIILDVKNETVAITVKEMTGTDLMYAYYALVDKIEEASGMPIDMLKVMFFKMLESEGKLDGND